MALFTAKMAKAKKLERAKDLFTKAVDADIKWQTLARTDFDFRDGDQWSTEEKQILEEELRPVLTFNLTKSSVDLIMGMNEDNRIKFRASPTEPQDGFLAEVLNDVTDFISESKEFEDEEDSALESAAICGRGFVAIDFVPDPKRFGEIEMTEVEVSVHEVHFDPAARRKDLGDASYICWDRWLPISEFNMRFPHIKGKRLTDIIAMGRQFGLDTVWNAEQPQSSFDIPFDISADDSDYDKPLDFNFYDKSKEMVRVIHMEYWDTFTRYFVFNPEANVFEEAPEKPTPEVMAMFEQEFGQPMVIETLMDKKVKWLQFIGSAILYDGDSPLPYPGFSLVPVFAYSDVSKRTMNHFGLVRLMRDPQKEINKRWSQALNMLNQQVQPGIYAETDAFVDASQAQQSMKEAGAITWTNAGAITGGKIKERTVPTFPNAPMQMEQFSQDIMKKITGINPDLLGQDRGRQEPGVVVRLRQQQGITLLKPLFSAFNRMKKELFKRQLAIIMAYMPDEQVLRILGSTERYQIDKESGIIVDQVSQLQAEFRDVRNLEYNIKSEEATGNMSKRMMELTALLEMQKQGLPVPPTQIIEKMEIPASEKQRWIEFIQQTQEQQAQKEQQMLQAEMQFKDREIAVKENANQLEYMIDAAKLNASVEKDKDKLVAEYKALSIEEQQVMLTFMIEMLKIAQEEEQAKQELRKVQQEMEQDAKSASQDLKQDAAKHNQDIKFTKEKQALDLKAAKEKQDQAMKFAKEKAAQAKKQGEANARALSRQQGPSSGKAKPKAKT
jgi:hypothetical protein